LNRHARPCAGQPRISGQRERRGAPGTSPAITS